MHFLCIHGDSREAPRSVDTRGPILTAQVSARVLTALIDVHVTECAL